MLVLWGAQGEASSFPVLHSGLEGLSAAGAAQEVELHCPTGNVFKDMPSLFLWNVMPLFKAACSSRGSVARFYSEVACPAAGRASPLRGGISSDLFWGVYFVSPKEQLALVD